MRKLNEIVVQAGVRVYRDIIPVALFSLMGSVFLAAIVFFLPLPVALLLIPFVYMPVFYGVLDAVHRMLRGEKAGIRHIFTGAAKGYGAAAVFGLFCMLMAVILVSTWWYYGGKDGILYLSLAIFQTYFVAMVLVSQFYALPLAIQERMGIFSAMGRSVKLAVTHPGYTLGAFVQALSLGVVLLVTVVGFAALFNGMFGIYAHMVTRNLLNPMESRKEDGKKAGGIFGKEFSREAMFR